MVGRQRRALVASVMAITIAASVIVGTRAGAATADGHRVAATAATQIGAAYRWGGNGPSFDCSGLVTWALRKHGISPPRSSAQLYQWVDKIPRSEAKPGDLVFSAFGRKGAGKVDHVAMYAGDGQVVTASSGQGRVIRRAIIDRAFVAVGRVPGMTWDTTAANRADGWAGGTTRAEAARIVADTLDLQDRSNPFGVTTEGGAVGAVYRARIGLPYRDGTFRPHAPITKRQTVRWLGRADVTRAEAATILAGFLGLEDRPNRFGIGGPHGGAIGALNEAGVAYPYRDGLFRPGTTISRYQLRLWTGRVR